MSTNPVVYVEKVQIRRGLEIELPGKPEQVYPLRLAPGLDSGEFGLTVDSGRLFIGHDPQPGDVNYQRGTFPYENLEVLTENSPRVREMFSEYARDQENVDFFLPTRLVRNGQYTLFQHEELGNNAAVIPTRFDGKSLAITIEYAAFVSNPSSNRNGWPVKQGEIRFLASPGGAPFPTTQGTPDEIKVEDPILIGGGLTFELQEYNNFYRLAYLNQTQEDVILYLRRVIVTGLAASNYQLL